jgi:hypothetical protein
MLAIISARGGRGGGGVDLGQSCHTPNICETRLWHEEARARTLDRGERGGGVRESVSVCVCVTENVLRRHSSNRVFEAIRIPTILQNRGDYSGKSQ